MESQQREEELNRSLEQDIFIMGIINPNEDGLLNFEDFDRLIRIIQKHAFIRLDIILEEDSEKRLNILREQGQFGHGYGEEYRQMVINSLKKEDTIYTEIARYVCE